MKKILVILTAISISCFGVVAVDLKYYQPTEPIVYDTIPYMVYDQVFEDSYSEMFDMYRGRVPYNMKRAEFLLENAFYGGRLDYSTFCHDIDSIVNVIDRFIEINEFRKNQGGCSFAVYKYFTEPSILNGFSAMTYDFDDPVGETNFPVFFTSNLIRTHKGQCFSMPVLFKILCDELGGQSALALAPNHIYIKVIGDDGRWYNIELTNGGNFMRDIWLMESFNISTEAIRHGTFLCALSNKENIALMMMHLVRAYEHKYKSFDYFALRCIQAVLGDLPDFSDALVMKFITLQDLGYKFEARFGYNHKTPYSRELLSDFRGVMHHLDSLGYTQISPEETRARLEEGRRYMENLRNEQNHR